MKRDEQIRMLLHPEEYSEEKLDQMLETVDASVPDAEEAWRRFEEEHVVKRQQGSWLKIAAIFVGVLMLSGIAYAAVHIIRSQETRDREQETVAAASSHLSTLNSQLAEQDSTLLKPVVYEDAELATILKDIATFYEVEPVYRTEACKHIRLYFTWDKKSTLEDIIDTFNKFERIHITRDNKKLFVE